jgi:hypothetical protein
MLLSGFATPKLFVIEAACFTGASGRISFNVS